MKIKPKILLISLIALLMIIIAVLTILNNHKKQANNEEIQPGNQELKPTYKTTKVSSISTYMTINNCVNTYLSNIKENKLEQNKLEHFITDIKFENEFLADEILEYNGDLNLKTYFVNGYVLNKENYQKIKISAVIRIDNTNSTFQIDALEKDYNYYIENNVSTIKKANYNEIQIVRGLNEKDIMQFYFNQYVLNMLFNPEKAYKILNDSYKSSRFANYDDFINYIDKEKSTIEKSVLSKYKIETFSDYKEYLCVDNLGNYYIFLEKEPLDFTVLLDQYTISDEIFMQQYRKKEDIDKAQMNLYKFEQMLNRKDYKKAYEVLNENFKEKYFKTQQDFEDYISQKLFKYVSFKIEEANSSDEGYKIKTTIKNSVNKSDEDVVKRFKINLLENDKFEISFDI